MVFYRERDNERPPLSLILPHLYLGAESDVTQDCLSARGISYVLSVSRCSPQPTFLPRSQYLRIPIDDSLRDDLLPWIPEALRFIDGAMSSGGSVLVHCAAGISRSPALAVAYIMYSLRMDLDHAYRFVKERRPSISPNFNFLGQLQHFQGTLSQKSSDGSPIVRPIKSLDTSLQMANENINRCSTGPLSTNQSMNYQDNCVTNDFTEGEKVCSENSYHSADKVEPRYSHSGETENILSGNLQHEQRNPSRLTLSLSGQLRTLTLTLNQNHREGQAPSEAATPSPREPATPLSKPTQLLLPTGYASLSEKRKSLTLSLSPMGGVPPANPQRSPLSNYNNSAANQQTACTANSKTVHRRETGAECEAKRHGNKPSVGVDSSAPAEEKQRVMSSSRTKAARPSHGSSQSRARGEREGRARGGKRNGGCPHSARKNETGRDRSRGKGDRQRGCSKSQCSAVVDQQPAPESKLAPSAVEAEESLAEDQGSLSPLNLTVNKLLGWGERMLLGVLLGPRIKVGQAALPYRC